MQRLTSYEQYSAVLADFKKGRPRCSTNKMLMRSELTDLIEAGKLYYEQIGDALWFFSHEGYFYSAQVYLPAGAAIRMNKQDKDVLVDLMGNETRYNEEMERALLAAGFEKNDKYREFTCELGEILDDVKKRVAALREFWGRQGFTCRKAVRADLPELHKLWMEELGRDTYNVLALTEKELDDMERFGRCIVICDLAGNISASCLYLKNGSICYGYITATYLLGLGGWASYEKYLSAYSEGCTRDMSWAREDNAKSINMSRYTKKPSGKFYWQFVYRTDN